MHLQLNNLNDKELLLRMRKLQDREAAGVLLDRYSHLLVAVCLPKLSKEKPAETVFPVLTRQLFAQLSSSFGKINETVYAIVQSYFSKGNKTNVPYHSPVQTIQRLESQVEQAGNNPIARTALTERIEQALQTLSGEEARLITGFYLEHLTLQELAMHQHTTADKIRNSLKGIRKKIATQLKDVAYE
ncbi:sigma-70 family RNA polymerase sigma factor [Chitinophaga sp. GCM10012297]|uniref:Sigma-70 family RNA polymerase sigma factor n=1 Tax=Chitinophaga chungangae TaxID=2821488 RepID=A0ABS3YGN9_9BACT|nr:sigma-70 family RNA polymerase sigma factor [Chitinophaga chungangae]MBO9153853.1 sigma-70 family RNA polymerase sigma factor [Chitinophaga chungangae]